MPLQASDIILSARDELLDNGVSIQVWTDTTFQRWLSEVQAAAVTLKRDIAPQIVQIPLTVGSIQNLNQVSNPNCIHLIAPYYNTQSGNAITPGGVVVTSRRFPGWRGATPQTDVVDVDWDMRAPAIFQVNPPNNGSGNITALVGTLPVVTASNSPIVIPDNYRFALQEGLISKAYAANTRRNDIAKAQFHWQIFEAQIMGAKIAQREISAPMQDVSEAGGG